MSMEIIQIGFNLKGKSTHFFPQDSTNNKWNNAAEQVEKQPNPETRKKNRHTSLHPSFNYVESIRDVKIILKFKL